MQGSTCLCQELFSVICLSVVLPDSSPPPESEFSKQYTGHSRAKLLVLVIPATTTNIPKHFEDALQQILKTVLVAQTLIPTPAIAPAPIASEVPRNKLKARSPGVYYGKSHINYYNFCL